VTRVHLPLALLIAAGVTAAGVLWSTRTAAGADSYGYVSQAELWLNGPLAIDQPWARDAPWPDATWSFSPLGYRPRDVPRDGAIVEERGVIVPTYSPGLPMVMALAKRVAGQCGLFAVVPVFGGLLVLSTYGLGRRLGSPQAGVLAAWLVATSPILLFMLVQPMSDVPAAGAWAVAFWCVLGSSAASALAAGAAAGLAVLIRPNLVPVAGIVGLWLVAMAWRGRPAGRAQGVRRVAAYAAALAPAIAATALLNRHWYGSPLGNGYAPLDELFAWSNVPLNLAHYTRVFVETQTPFALLGVGALLVPRIWAGHPDRPWIAGLFAASFAGIWGEYLAYQHFDYWFILRLLLPVWPFVMLAMAMAMTWPVRATGRRLVALAVAVAGLALGAHTLRGAADRNAFGLQRDERRYPAVAALVRARTNRNAVVFSMQHSGTLRYYGARTTVQYMHFDAEWLDRAVAWFDERGAQSYALLEDWEVPVFRERFGPANVLGRLEAQPVLRYGGGSGRIFLYDLRQPAGAPAVSEHVFEPPAMDACPRPAPAPRLVWQ
jgi:hypothetical protein